MPGLRVRSVANNTVLFDTNAGDRAALIMANFNIDYASNGEGSINIPGLAGSRGFAFPQGYVYQGAPIFTFSGDTLSWQRPVVEGRRPTSGTFNVLAGGVDVVNVTGGARLNLRNPATGKVTFSSMYPMLTYGGAYSFGGKLFDYQNAGVYAATENSVSPGRVFGLRTTNLTAPVGNFYDANYGGNNGLYVAAKSAPNGSMWTFKKPTIAAAKPGFNTRSVITGELTYSTNHVPMRVADVWTGGEGRWVGTEGRSYVAVYSGPIMYGGDEETSVTLGGRNGGGQLVIGDNPPYYVWKSYALGVRFDANHIINFEYLNTSGNNYGEKRSGDASNPSFNTGGSILIVDITGL